jgi:hypothetical protein
MHGTLVSEGERSDWPDTANDASDVVALRKRRQVEHARVSAKHRSIFSLVAELRRRKVCRAATAYCIALWLSCQVIDIVAAPLGLPDWSLEFVILVGLAGFPVAMILSWLFEVTPDGLVLDNDAAPTSHGVNADTNRSRFDQVIDCSLLLVAIVIGAELAFASVGSTLMASPATIETLTINRFSVTTGPRSDAFAGALQVELQHEVGRMPNVKVLVPGNDRLPTSASSLTGSVTMADTEIQITAVIVNNETGELVWSDTVSLSAPETGGSPRAIAKGIVTTLEGWSDSLLAEGRRNEG